MQTAARRITGLFGLALVVKSANAVRVLYDEPLRTADAIITKSIHTTTSSSGDLPPFIWNWWLASCTFDRFVRDIVTAGRVANIYMSRARTDGDWPSAHRASALAFLSLAQANGGVYVKAAQHLSQLDYMLPPEYGAVLSVMTHAAPRDSWALACKIFKDDTGFSLQGPDSPFASINTTPIASASLAQVHVGILREGGTKVAVKIQHAGLFESAAADIATIRALAHCAAWVFPAFDLAWLADEVATNLPRELDFRLERANMERATKLWAEEKDIAIAIPRPIQGLSLTPRVLVMTFEEGCYVNDVAAIKSARLLPSKVAELTTRIFSRAVFSHGFAHCDPHAANVLVRPRKPRTILERGWQWIGSAPQPEIVLLDHGLYKDLRPALRRSYAAMWAALTRGDANGMRKAGKELGCGQEGDGGGAFALLASMLAARSYDRILAIGTSSGNLTSLAESGSLEERARLAKNAREYAVSIAKLLRTLPRDLLLLLKLNDCLRTVELSLGLPGHNFGTVAREAQRSQAREARQQNAPHFRLSTEINLFLDKIELESRLAGLGVLIAGMKSWK